MNKSAILFIMLSLLLSGSALAQTLTFELRNEKVNAGSYEFDVYMKADQAGTFHSRGQVYISYNTSALGSAIVENGNVTVTPLALLTGASQLGAKYQTVNVADNGANLAITWQSNFLGAQPGTSAHTEVPTTSTALYRVSIKMASVNANPQLAFNMDLMKGQQFYLTGSNNEIPYGEKVGSLPIVLLDLAAQKANFHDVKLSWVTSREINSSFFVIEKKRNGGDFSELTQVEAAGVAENGREYSYLDQSGMGITNEYRLKMVDMDGSFEYSDVVTVEFDESINDKFNVFPSPATTTVTLKATGQVDGDYNFSLSDLNGRILQTGAITRDTPSGAVELDVSDYAAGTYIIKTVSPTGKSYLNKVVKVNE